MKQAIHPDYHPVVFRDRAANFAFLTRSTATSERTITWEDGKTSAGEAGRSSRPAASNRVISVSAQPSTTA